MRAHANPKGLTEAEAIEIIRQLNALTLSEHYSCPSASKLQPESTNLENDIEMADASVSDTSTTADPPPFDSMFKDEGTTPEIAETPEERQRKIMEKHCIEVLLQSDKFVQKALLQEYLASLKSVGINKPQ